MKKVIFAITTCIALVSNNTSSNAQEVKIKGTGFLTDLFNDDSVQIWTYRDGKKGAGCPNLFVNRTDTGLKVSVIQKGKKTQTYVLTRRDVNSAKSWYMATKDTTGITSFIAAIQPLVDEKYAIARKDAK
jgi:hypothetical protein